MAVFSDIDFSFTLDSGGDIKLVSNAEAISQSIRMILETRLGYRPGPGNELFGTDVFSYLFSPVTTTTSSEIGNTILIALTRYESRISIREINMNIVNDREYHINIFYEILIPEESGVKTFNIVLESLWVALIIL